ncbi:MAG: MBL fold metallo-hydrolase [Balneola sp.]
MKNLFFILFLTCMGCSNPGSDNKQNPTPSSDIELVVLGIAQDAGFPQANCEKENCRLFWEGKVEERYATSLGLIDHRSGKYWIFEATPDFKHQFQRIKEISQDSNQFSGIFLTHAHMGHYTGLMHLGREVMGANNVPVYVMPKMGEYLKSNGPWSQLVNLENIAINALTEDSPVELNGRISVTPFLVPHRDEFSETVGYKIETDSTSVLFIPDINKWGIWERSIIEEVSKVDYAFLDGTFYDQNELPGRDMSEIPHPFIEESLKLFEDLEASEKAKIQFIHFNHTNPLILDSPERKKVEELGFKVAFEGLRINLK